MILHIVCYSMGRSKLNKNTKSALSKYGDNLVESIIRVFDDDTLKGIVQKNRDFKYIPFEGHQSRLGHYYRHLYQTVCYVDSQDEKYISNIEKYKYMKILRAQLSTHEEALLFLNSLSLWAWIGKKANLLRNTD